MAKVLLSTGRGRQCLLMAKAQVLHLGSLVDEVDGRLLMVVIVVQIGFCFKRRVGEGVLIVLRTRLTC